MDDLDSLIFFTNIRIAQHLIFEYLPNWLQAKDLYFNLFINQEFVNLKFFQNLVAFMDFVDVLNIHFKIVDFQTIVVN